MTSGPIRRIVIVGGGTAGWMTAAALSRALDTKQVSIMLIESDAIGTVGVGEATIPSMTAFNSYIGLDEHTFMRETQATHKLGIEFVDWRAPGDRYFHPFGQFGVALNSVSFHHYWRRQRDQGNRHPLADYSLETLAARANKFVHNTGIGHPELASLNYAFHLDAGLYAKLLRGRAEASGVVRREGQVSHVFRAAETGHIESVTLDDGSLHGADLFIDCSGFRALLIGETLGVPFCDWSDLLPCDRAWAVQCERKGPLTPYTRATARPAGWQWRIPLRHRIGNGHVFSTRYMDEGEARDLLMASLEGAPLTEPRLIRFRVGRRARLWDGNCVAIGLSGGFIEPLESTSIHLIQLGIMRLLGYFPDRRVLPVLLDRYNAELNLHLERIRDFIVLHYHLNHRPEPMWRDLRELAPPAYLAQKMALYAASGVIPWQDEELFREASWLAVLEGQGATTTAHLPQVDRFASGRLDAEFAQLRTTMTQAVTDMPTEEVFVTTFCQPRSGPVGQTPRPNNHGECQEGAKV